MTRQMPVRFKNGVFVPLTPVSLPEREYVIEVSLPLEAGTPTEALAAWGRVYEGLSPDEIDAVERIALDRDHFMEPVEE